MTPILLLASLLLNSNPLWAACSVASELCSARSNLVYQWEFNLFPELEKSCALKPDLKVDWPSLRPTFKELQSNATASPCEAPGKVLLEICKDRKDLKQIKTIACGYAVERKFSYKNGTLTFLFNPDYRAINKQEGSDEDLIKAELNKLFPAPTPSPTPKPSPTPVPAATPAPSPTPNIAHMQKQISEATAWFQGEMAKIQASSDTPTQKAEKMQKLSLEFQSRMKKAQEAP